MLKKSTAVLGFQLNVASSVLCGGFIHVSEVGCAW